MYWLKNFWLQQLDLNPDYGSMRDPADGLGWNMGWSLNPAEETETLDDLRPLSLGELIRLSDSRYQARDAAGWLRVQTAIGEKLSPRELEVYDAGKGLIRDLCLALDIQDGPMDGDQVKTIGGLVFDRLGILAERLEKSEQPIV